MDNNGESKPKDEREDLPKIDALCLFLAIVFSGFTVAYLSVITKSQIDNTIIPLILILIASIIIVGGKGAGRIFSANPRFSNFYTSIFIIFLCLSILLTTLGLTSCSSSSGTTEASPQKRAAGPPGILKNVAGPENPEDYSFVVFGDTRTVLFLAKEKNNKKEIMEEIRRRYKEKEAKLTPDDGNNLESFIINKDNLRVIYRKDKMQKRSEWPLEIKRDGKKIYDGEAQNKIYAKVIELLGAARADGRADLAIHTGDLVLWSGRKGEAYWDDFNRRFYEKLKKRCFSDRFYPVVGNHENWVHEDDEDYNDKTRMFYKYFKHIKTGSGHDYAFEYGSGYFIFLCTGTYAERTGASIWECEARPYFQQVGWLNEVLEEVKNKEDIKHLFVTYHKPSYTLSEHPPLHSRYDISGLLSKFKREMKRSRAREISVLVFNGHNHTTEVFKKEGIRFFVLGGGGAPQDFSRKKWRDQPKELYWKNGREERYTFLQVGVMNDRVEFTMHEFHPAGEGRFKYIKRTLREVQIGAKKTAGLRRAA